MERCNRRKTEREIVDLKSRSDLNSVEKKDSEIKERNDDFASINGGIITHFDLFLERKNEGIKLRGRIREGRIGINGNPIKKSRIYDDHFQSW